MNKIIAGFLMVVSMQAVASGNHDLEFTAQERYEDVTVGWIVSNDVVQTCNMAIALSGNRVKYNPKILACAVANHNSNTCVIYTAQRLSLAVLGHEVRHCFEGAWHE
jgi:flavin reductase (DIM6/NTAB) family NADH-FMN oxidoreductase RutF